MTTLCALPAIALIAAAVGALIGACVGAVSGVGLAVRHRALRLDVGCARRQAALTSAAPFALLAVLNPSLWGVPATLGVVAAVAGGVLAPRVLQVPPS